MHREVIHDDNCTSSLELQAIDELCEGVGIVGAVQYAIVHYHAGLAEACDHGD